jgi:deazaflavin-dependent oxidoreductase (nitroreductase family)
VPLPHSVARFNKRVTNRFVEPVARRFRGFAVVHHTGRRSGTAYTTPVNLFGLGSSSIVVLTYGPSADWVQNVLASGGEVEDGTGLRRIEQAEVVARSVAWPALPLLVRGVLRVLRVHDFMRLSLAGASRD